MSAVPRLTAIVTGAVVIGIVAAGVATRSSVEAPRTGRIPVIAAENFWGAIARAVGGDAASVSSIIANPSIDPHAYEPTAADARRLAGASLVIVNGLGYDPWATRLVAVDEPAHLVDVGSLLGLASDANPHRWYDPQDVRRVATAIHDALVAIEPARRAYLDGRLAAFERSLGPFRTLVRRIRGAYAGTPVGASESIFSLLAPALRLNLVTPRSFLRATSEGGEPTPRDLEAITAAIDRRAIWVYVVNRQNTTPEVENQLAACRAHDIPVVSITETLTPPSASFVAWQTRQLEALERALRAASAQRGSV